ncbi:AraC family transcriptional regulator [Catenovulum agarivorans DS-2]|uniref:AraC family transcriptional regulator n=1 Tax=Catenovulum agarivorans DS-2 TaxID=1328313 RepID=W7QUI1_9ALTE|nr:DNA-binding transcriptional regulator [Catenovulum agarivorans]EWH11523.1 AraC family transcriptional regulator [Catenovulum agarivorans DS-2]
MKKLQKVAVLFNANKGYDRKIIKGISRYSREVASWHICVEEDLVTRLDKLANWQGDGMIADFDDPSIVEFVMSKNIPCVAVGSSYRQTNQYPNGIHYVATNNDEIARLGVEHISRLGLKNIAFYTGFTDKHSRWAVEREQAFIDHAAQYGYQQQDIHVLRPQNISVDRVENINQLADWIASLPKPIGIMAPTDMRAWHVFEACHQIDVSIPEEVAVLGVDGDDLILDITGNQLSTVTQGSEHMGYLASSILNQVMAGVPPSDTIHLVDPIGLQICHSTDLEVISDIYVRKALSFIKNNADKGIKVIHVLNHLGISRANLDKRFKSALNATVHEVIFDEQLNLVSNYLLNSKMTLQQIADAVGYKSPQYMMMVFKGRYGVTPSEFRKNHGA